MCANIKGHYTYITGLYRSFVDRCARSMVSPSCIWGVFLHSRSSLLACPHRWTLTAGPHESYFLYIPPCLNRYVPQYKAHSAILATFQELMAAMAAVALPPQLRIGG